MKKMVITLLTVILNLFLTSCTGISSLFSSPLASAEGWFTVFNKPDVIEIDNLTCQTERQYIRSIMQDITPQLSIIYDSNWEDISFQLLDRDDDYAIVSVQGEIKRVTGGALEVEEVDENMLMVRENKTWKWCGFTDMDTVEIENILSSQTIEQEQLCKLDMYPQYCKAAFGSFEKFRREGYIAGQMLDPLSIENSETRLVTGFIPGWFCVPERLETCEMMLGISLQSLAPEFPNPQADIFETYARQYKQDQFFAEIRRNWDYTWLPYLLQNPNISSDIKEFYRADNRMNICVQFMKDFPTRNP